MMKQLPLVFMTIFILVTFSGSKGLAQGAQEENSDVAPNQMVPPAETSSGGSTSPNPAVLDFDADVIEGEREAPALFVQMDIQTPKLDTLVFQRKNFNDFHLVERNRKPWYRIKTK